MALLSQFTFTPAELETQRLPAAPANYVMDSSLSNAVKVAVLLKQPLLVTGEPGTGKTRLAEKLAADLHRQYPDEFLGKPLVFHTKTSSVFTDLFYSYDALGHFHAAHYQAEDAPQATRFIQLEALGQAIVLSNENALRDCHYRGLPAMPNAGKSEQPTPGPRSTVVLIDEVDKAPRDFTNDLLNELDRFEFAVREDHNRVFRKGSKNIFVILTSNAERNLPDAFLRRCIFYHIPPPSNEQLERIVLDHIFAREAAYPERKGRINKRISEYVARFMNIQQEGLKKKPHTAELISWMYYLRHEIIADKSWERLRQEDAPKLRSSYSILAKHPEDLERLVNDNG